MARGDYKSAELDNESAGAEEATARTSEVTFSEAGGAAIAAVLHLLRLVSAELVLHHGLDIGRFETAARKKIDEFTSLPPTRRRVTRGSRSRITYSNCCWCRFAPKPR